MGFRGLPYIAEPPAEPQITISDVAPEDAEVHDVWLDTNPLPIDIKNEITVSTEAPDEPALNDLWLDI